MMRAASVDKCKENSIVDSYAKGTKKFSNEGTTLYQKSNKEVDNVWVRSYIIGLYKQREKALLR